MSKEEAFEKYSDLYHDIIGDGFECVNKRDGLIAMEEHAKEVAIGFLEWAMEEEWQNYDGHDRWIKGRTVLETKQLYQQYLNQRS